MIRKLRQWFLEKRDWFIYYRAYHSLRRMCERNAGFAYLLDLNIRQWRADNPISRELQNSTELFYESLSGQKAIRPDSGDFIVHGRVWQRSEKVASQIVLEPQCRGYSDGVCGITENPYPEGSSEAALWRAGQEAAAIALIDGGE